MASRGAEIITTTSSSENDCEIGTGSNPNCNINALIASAGGGSGGSSSGGECSTTAGGSENGRLNGEIAAWTQRKMQAFHPRCGSRITLTNGNRTAMRSVRDFSHALVFSAERLTDNVLFEVVIERKNHSWGGSIEIGVTHEPPNELELLSTATAMRNGTWVVSGTEVRRNGECINSRYGIDLETLIESDRVGVMRTNKDELIIYVNGFSMGVADYNMPRPLWALVNLYGRCVQVSIYPYVDTDNGAALCRQEMGEPVPPLQQQQQQQQHYHPQQPIPPLMNIDVACSHPTSNSGNVTSVTSTLAEAVSSANFSLANVLAAACSSLPSPLLFPRQQNSGNTNPQNSSGGAISSTNAISTIGGPSSSSSSSQHQSSDFFDMNERLRFHTRCGSLVKLSTNFRSAERRRPLDEFNNGVVMTHRPLKDNELFEIRIDKLVDKWSGSIEVGVTTHNPTVLHFPATMTNMRSGTIMMSGCGILTNGKGTRRQYGEFNLDELAEGDRVGMMRKANGNLHYYINGQDQGVAATRVASTLWGVIDLYGMTIKVTIVDRDEREQQNLVTRRNNLLVSNAAGSGATAVSSTTNLTPLLNLQSPELELQVSGDDSAITALTGGMSSLNSANTQRPDDRLTFNPLCGSHARVTHGGRTALRPNASDDFNNGVVLTRRPLRTNELFQVRLERVVTKWAGSVEMGVTIYSAEELDFPFTMTNIRTGTWMMTGNGVMQNGITVIEQYGQNLDRLQVGDRVGVMRKDDGSLHFWVNGVDQGLAAIGVPERVYGVIDLYGQAAQASIVDTSECGSPDTGNSTISNTSLYSEPPLRFHVIHGKNANISSNGLTASRPNSLGEFNDSLVFSNRPLRQRELFEVVLENMVRHWSGNIEIGVTGTRPEDITLSQNAADLEAPETVILCGSMLFYNRKTIRSNVPMDLDLLSVNTRVGVMRNGDFIHFFINGVDHGPACELRSPNIWAIVDIYGQCAQVSLTQTQPIDIPRVAPYATSENSQSCQATSVIQPANLETKHRWTCVSGLVQLSQNWTVASRATGTTAALTRCLVFSEHPLRLGSPFEIRILVRNPLLAGSLSIGVTDLNLRDEYVRRNLPVNIKRIPANVWYLTNNELRHNMSLLQRSATSLEWLRTGDRISLELTTGRTLRVLFNSEDMNIHFYQVAKNPYVVVELHGSTMTVQVISSQAPMSPLRPCILRLQDSLDFGADPLNKQDSMLESMESEVINLEFLEHYGKNIRLLNDNRTAVRASSFNHGIIFGNKTMSKGDCICIKVEKVNPKWNGTIGIGFVGFSPVLLDPIPPSLLQITRRCWGITKDYITVNGQQILSDYGEALDNIQAGTLITLTYAFSNVLIVTVGGTTLEEVGTLPDYVYPVFDLYGKCEQITVAVVSSNDGAVLTSSISPPTTLTSTVETVITTTVCPAAMAGSTTTMSTVAAIVAEISAERDDDMSFENDGECNLSREKADLECHEKETNESEPPSEDRILDVRRLVEDTDEEEAENDDLTSLHASPGFMNLHANSNRSVMENVSENLFTNLSIQIRSLELRQTEMNTSASNSSSCRLRESLQLHHNTNYNIQRSQSNQRLQQQSNQNNPMGTATASASAAAVHDTNKDYEDAESGSIFEDCVPQQNAADNDSSYSAAVTNNDLINSCRTRVGAFILSEMANDAASTTGGSNNTGAGGCAGVSGAASANASGSSGSSSARNNRPLDDRALQTVEIFDLVEAALDSTSNSSDSSNGARDRTPLTRNANSVGGDNISVSSTDSFTSMANFAIASRMANASLSINDLLLDSSSDGSICNENENRNADRSEQHESSDDEVFVTIMGLNAHWRQHSPIQEESQGGASDAIENSQSDTDSMSYVDLLHSAVVRVSTLLDRVNDMTTRDSSPMLIASNYDSMQSLSTTNNRDCPYLQLVKQFFSSLVLPSVFFTQPMEPLCFCSNCNLSGRLHLNGWVYFKLDSRAANAHEIPESLTEGGQYFCMYFVTRVDKIRAILDFGQLVPQDSASDGEIHTPSSSCSSQKDEPGTRLELHFAPDNEASMSQNAQLNFTHNGKKYRIGAAFEVFVRHQALCSLPSNKLTECSSNRGDLHSLSSVPSATNNSVRNVITSLMYGGDSSSENNSPVHAPAGRNSANDVVANGPSSSSNDGINVPPLSNANSNTSLNELTWFTKEDGSCFINALVLRLEEFNGDEISFDSSLDD